MLGDGKGRRPNDGCYLGFLSVTVERNLKFYAKEFEEIIQFRSQRDWNKFPFPPEVVDILNFHIFRFVFEQRKQNLLKQKNILIAVYQLVPFYCEEGRKRKEESKRERI